MRIWFDTEFMEDGSVIEMLSIGMIREDGRTYYAEPEEADLSHANPWVTENALPHLTRVTTPRRRLASEIVEFAGHRPEFWAYFADYDWVVLCQLYGTMMDLPQGWPMFCMDLQQEIMRKRVAEVPPMNGPAHNALNDAIWCKQAWEHVMAQPERTA